MSPSNTAAEDRADAVRTLTWYLQRCDQTPAPDTVHSYADQIRATLARRASGDTP